MQSAIFAKPKMPTDIKRKILIVAFIVVNIIAALGLSTQKAGAWASFMLIDAPACSRDCPYGPEKSFKRFNKVWMVCYRDMRWRYTNGQWSNRWYRVLSTRYPNLALYTPAPAVGNPMSVGYCR